MEKIKRWVKNWVKPLFCGHTETQQIIKTGHNLHGGVHIYTKCTRCGKIIKKEFFKL